MKINHLKYKVLVEYSNIYGYTMDDIALKGLLSQIGCQKAITILSGFDSIHIGMCNQNQDAIDLESQLRMLHFIHIKNSKGNWELYNKTDAIMCPQSIFTLAKFVLVYCPIEEKLGKISLQDIMLMLDALMAINDRLPKDDIEGKETEYLYLMMYHNTHKIIKNQIARAYYIFSILAKQDECTSNFLDCYEEIRGFSIEDRLTVLFDSLMTTTKKFKFENIFADRMFVGEIFLVVCFQKKYIIY